MLRKNSGRYHLIAVVAVFGACALALGARALIRGSAPAEKIRIYEVTQLANIAVETEPQAIPSFTPPPPALKEVIKFTPPVVKPDEDVKPEDEIKTREQLENAEIASAEDSTDAGTGTGVEGGIAQGEGSANPFFVAEQMPEFPGGETAMRNYLARNIQYPAEAQAKRIQGTIIVSFVVGKNGSISDIKIERGFDKSFENEALRVISQMPKWNPGKQRGKPVYVRLILPLRFNL